MITQLFAYAFAGFAVVVMIACFAVGFVSKP